jgi:hypothetical protein
LRVFQVAAVILAFLVVHELVICGIALASKPTLSAQIYAPRLPIAIRLPRRFRPLLGVKCCSATIRVLSAWIDRDDHASQVTVIEERLAAATSLKEYVARSVRSPLQLQTSVSYIKSCGRHIALVKSTAFLQGIDTMSTQTVTIFGTRAITISYHRRSDVPEDPDVLRAMTTFCPSRSLEAQERLE